MIIKALLFNQLISLIWAGLAWHVLATSSCNYGNKNVIVFLTLPPPGIIIPDQIQQLLCLLAWVHTKFYIQNISLRQLNKSMLTVETEIYFH